MDILTAVGTCAALGGVGWSAKDAWNGIRRSHERTLSDFLPWRRPINEHTVTTSEDEYLTVFRFAARDKGAQGEAELFEVARRLAATLGSLRPKADVKVQFYAVRERVREYTRPRVSAGLVLDAADEERERYFIDEEPGFETVRYLVLSLRPAAEDLVRFRVAAAKDVDAAIEIEQKMLGDLEAVVSRLRSSLDDAFEMVERLGEYTAVDDFGVERRRSELLEFLHFFVIGKFSPFNVPDESLIELHGLLSSRGFQGRVAVPKIGEDFVLPILLKTFPKETEAGVLDELTRVGVAHYFSVRYSPLTLAEVHKETRDIVLDFQGQAKQNKSFVDPGAVDSAEEVADAHGVAKGAYTQFGFCTFTVVVRAKTLADLVAAKNALISALEKAGFPNAYVPELAAWEAIISTFPGASRWSGVHKHLEHALALSTLVPLHAHNRGRMWSDHPYRVPKTPPHFYAMGPGQALTRVHTSSADVEHLLGLAPSGWGKTSFQSYLGLMRLARLPLSSMAYFDKGLGAYRAAMMVDGAYYDLLGSSNAPGLALFDGSLDDDTVIEILSDMVQFWEPYTRPSADEDESLRRALRVITAPNYPVEYRSLTAFCKQLQDMGPGRLGPALRKYTDEGPLRGTLDASVDSFTASNTWTVFNIEHVIEMEPKFLIPLLKSLFEKILASARRRRSELGERGQFAQMCINLDESHLLQGHPAGRKFILDILKMGRAQNLGLSLWSNGLKEFAESPDRSELMLQIKTRVFGVGAGFAGDAEREYLRSLGVNARGVHQITHPGPDGTRDFLLCQPDEGIQQILNARLDGPMLALIGDPRNNFRVDEFIDRFPPAKWGAERWKIELLEREGQHSFAQRLRVKLAFETPGAMLQKALA